MAKSVKKKSISKAKTSGKGSARPRSKKFMILFVIAGLILLAELVTFIGNKANEAKEVTVQKTLEFSGENTLSGPFKAWDLMAFGSGLAVSDQGQNRILLFDRQSKLLDSITQDQAGEPGFKEPSCLTSDPSGNLYVMDTWNGLIRGFSPNGDSILKLDLNGKGFYGPRGIVWDNNAFIIADTGSHRVVKVAVDGNILGAWGTRGSGKTNFNNPYQAITDGSGNYYIVDRDNDRIQVLDTQGKPEREIKIGSAPTAEAIDLKKKWLYVSSLDGRFVKVYSLEGKFIGNLSEAGQKGQPIPDINALAVFSDGDIAALRGGNHILIYHIVPTPPQS